MTAAAKFKGLAEAWGKWFTPDLEGFMTAYDTLDMLRGYRAAESGLACEPYETETFKTGWWLWINR